MTVLFLLSLIACNIENQPGGTAVGNPTGLSVETAPALDVTVKTATAALGDVTFTWCDGTVEAVSVGTSVDLLGGVDLETPAGTFCSVVFAFTGPLAVTATGPKGADITLSLDVISLRFANADGFTPDGTPVIVELGEPDWLSAAGLGATGVDDVTIDGGPIHDQLVAIVRHRSACFEDTDGDGAVSDAERASGPYAVAAAGHEDDEGDGDSDSDD